MSDDATTPQPEEQPGGTAAAGVTGTPGDALRALPAEAEQRGSRFISAQAMQARLFSVYDAASAAEDALALVQSQLTLTLNRSYYDADEVEAMASQLDALLLLDAAERIEDAASTEAAAADGDLAPVGPEE